MWLPVPSGWWTSGAGPAPPLPPAGPGRSCHDVTGQEINLDFPEAQVGCDALEAIRWLWTAAWLRNRSLTVPGPVTDWPCRAVTPSLPGYDPARPGGGQRFTSTVTLIRDLFANVSYSWASSRPPLLVWKVPNRFTRRKLGRSKIWKHKSEIL